jgi:hypothetical protein
MISSLEAGALIAVPVFTTWFYRRLTTLKRYSSPILRLLIALLAAVGLVGLGGLVAAMLWPDLADIDF